MYFIQSELFYYNLLSVVTKKESNLKEKKKHKMLPAYFSDYSLQDQKRLQCWELSEYGTSEFILVVDYQ